MTGILRRAGRAAGSPRDSSQSKEAHGADEVSHRDPLAFALKCLSEDSGAPRIPAGPGPVGHGCLGHGRFSSDRHGTRDVCPGRSETPGGRTP